VSAQSFEDGAFAEAAGGGPLGLYQLLRPEVLANPYPLYQRLRNQDPVHWDPYLRTWVVTGYTDVRTVLQRFSARCTPTPEQLTELGMERLTPIARVMVRQMLFLDPPEHTRVRALAAKAFTPRRVEALRAHISEIVDRLLDAVLSRGTFDVVADLARPLPAIVSAEMLGLPTADWPRLTEWSRSFAEVLGNFQYSPDRAAAVLDSLEAMTAYFQRAIGEAGAHGQEGLLYALKTAEVDGDRLSEEEVIANAIITMVGGQETTTNLIGNGTLSLLKNPDQWERLRADPTVLPSAIEELLRYETPSQYTARLAPEDRELGGKVIRQGQVVTAVMGAANRDPDHFPHPDCLDLGRRDDRHLAFGWGGHYCFGAPLARLEGQLAFAALAERMGHMRLAPGPQVWRQNLGLRGLEALHVEL
jgi:pimeloyl-[acyl-carrier protein] synthase